MKLLSLFKGRQDLALVSMLMMIVLVMIIPLPTVLIDAMIVLNIALTIMILMVAVYLERPDDFSVFPAVILIATTFRLAVSVSTTRMILSQADAGDIVETFGTFVVITKGSERVAEVAARFTLDALPGRQMSIDAELRAGDITSEEAAMRRRKLEKENQFFGAMDGSMKFVKGDAIAGLIIIAINLVGGISIGILSKGLSAGDAAQVYSTLTVGDGLVSQLPALIMAICAGTIITRVTTEEQKDLGSDITEQLIGKSKSLCVGAVLIALIGFIPGFPTILFIAMATVLAVTGFFISKREKVQLEEEELANENTANGLPSNKAEADKSIAVSENDVFKILAGSEVFAEFDRHQFIQEREIALARGFRKTGIDLPVFGVKEDKEIEPSRINLLLDNVSVFSAEIPTGVKVAICDADILELNGLPVIAVDPTWPLRSAYWIDESNDQILNDAGIEVIPMGELLARLGSHYLITKVSRILGYKAVQEIIKDLAKEHDQLATQVSQTLSPVQMLNVLRNLLDDGVPLLPRRILFEALLEGTLSGGSAANLAEQARFALARQVCSNYADENRLIAGYVIEPQMETAIINSINFTQEDNNFHPDATLSDHLLKDIADRHQIEELNAKPPVIITKPELRRPLAQFLKAHNMAFHVVAFRELSGEFNFNPIGTIGAEYGQEPVYEDAA